MFSQIRYTRVVFDNNNKRNNVKSSFGINNRIANIWIINFLINVLRPLVESNVLARTMEKTMVKALITVRQIFCLSPSRHTNRASRDQISYRKFRDDDLVSARLLSLRSKSRFERMFLILPRTDRFKLSSVASSFIFFFSCIFANQSIVRIEISKIIIFCLEAKWFIVTIYHLYLFYKQVLDG